MPYIPSTPAIVAKGVVTTENVALDTVHITSLKIDVDPNKPEKTSVVCTVTSGLMDTGVFVDLKAETFVLQGNDVLIKMMGATQDGETIYDSVKRGLYELLIARALIPAGTVT